MHLQSFFGEGGVPSVNGVDPALDWCNSEVGEEEHTNTETHYQVN